MNDDDGHTAADYNDDDDDNNNDDDNRNELCFISIHFHMSYQRANHE